MPPVLCGPPTPITHPTLRSDHNAHDHKMIIQQTPFKAGAHLSENIHTRIFTPQEYQVELLNAAKARNVLVCLACSASKHFVAVMLIREMAQDLRKGGGKGGAKKTVVVAQEEHLAELAAFVQRLTDLSVRHFQKDGAEQSWGEDQWRDTIRQTQVLVTSSAIFTKLLEEDCIWFKDINLLIIDNCHEALNYQPTRQLMRMFESLSPCHQPKVLALTAPILNSTCDPCRLEDQMNKMERVFCCHAETASDIVSVLRYCAIPKEVVVECAIPQTLSDLEGKILSIVTPAMKFLESHRHDPSEIYAGEEFEEMIKAIPDPKEDPQRLFSDFLYTLHTLGPWCADRAALLLIIQIEKLKVRTPYERHYLLLSMTSTVMVSVRAVCDEVFQQYSEKERIYHFAKPKDLSRCDPDFSFLSPQYTVHLRSDLSADSREAEMEHRKQEEVLRRFRMRESNLLVATSVLEEGIDVPKCNLVVRFDIPTTYQSYVHSKGRARAQDAEFCILVGKTQTDTFLDDLAQYYTIEELLLRKCQYQEATASDEAKADYYDQLLPAFCSSSSENGDGNATRITMASAVALVNRYCAKLPSDTFTRLTPVWHMEPTPVGETFWYRCHLQLPINSPVKRTIVGSPMPTKALAKRAVAVKTCQILHSEKELDNNLLPVGKESIQYEEDLLDINSHDEEPVRENEPRPGTTKRRQYYYKRAAETLTDCRPRPGTKAYLYHIKMILTCPIPEEQNTRGRKIYAPEASEQGFGILTLKEIPNICQFPIFTRSGEVCVDLELSQTEIELTEAQLEKVVVFLNYTFTSVLRLEKYLMTFDPQGSENSYFIVPTFKCGDEPAEMDWDFLDLIFTSRDIKPQPIVDGDRKEFECDPQRYQDAVVMPWYRNQDQPQYFYVAEICHGLNPKSSFPGSEYKTFEEYYYKKYSIQIQNLAQPLLDVDHTSARLNFLTPRYVNRKGVALPTSSEETKRAKRENLEQKQILVPELCMIHPFPASLWRKAVCLPCIMYRVNALLLANQVRVIVAREIRLGMEDLHTDFKWPSLDFGWTLADVLKRSREAAKDADGKPKHESKSKALVLKRTEKGGENSGQSTPEKEKSVNEILHEEELKLRNSRESLLEIGTWSNDMAYQDEEDGDFDIDHFDPRIALPDNLTVVCSGHGNNPEIEAINRSDWGTGIKERRRRAEPVRYGSPSSFYPELAWGKGTDYQSARSDNDDYESESCSDMDNTEAWDSDTDIPTGFKIEFKGDNVAEAIETDEPNSESKLKQDPDCFFRISDRTQWDWDGEVDEQTHHCVEEFRDSIRSNRERILREGIFLPDDREIKLQRRKGVKTESARATDEEIEEMRRVMETILDETEARVGAVSEEVKKPKNELVVSTPANGKFGFDSQPDLTDHPGPSPAVLLQALTMSNANDGINLERLETIGDSFLKYAITTYLFCAYDSIHEGKLSHLRSKQVSNLNLYRLGRRKGFGECMVATKFEPHDNWLPPCYYVPRELEQALIESGVPASHWNMADIPSLRDLSSEQICQLVREKGERLRASLPEDAPLSQKNIEELPCFIPYNLITQHSLPDKSIADCVEALIGAYLTSCGPRGALLFMSWLGIRVLPHLPDNTFGHLSPPKSPLLTYIPNTQEVLEHLLDGYNVFEENLGYKFRDCSYLLQAFTHASYYPNRLTDCYQRLEFLGDAILDYLITRHLYEDPRQHSPGALTDLRSALVNNTIFASLAVRFGFHRYFRHLSPGLTDVVNRFVRIQEDNGHKISEEYYLIEEEECEEAEDVEVPKALGDVFESVAGAIFLDSGMSLDAVWRVYYQMMKNEIEQFSTNVPKSPIRELLELEPETAKFGKPEKLADGRRVRVTVEVFGKGTFKGIGRNYRIAKCTAAKCALKQLKKKGLLTKKS